VQRLDGAAAGASCSAEPAATSPREHSFNRSLAQASHQSVSGHARNLSKELFEGNDLLSYVHKVKLIHKIYSLCSEQACLEGADLRCTHLMSITSACVSIHDLSSQLSDAYGWQHL